MSGRVKQGNLCSTVIWRIHASETRNRLGKLHQARLGSRSPMERGMMGFWFPSQCRERHSGRLHLIPRKKAPGWRCARTRGDRS